MGEISAQERSPGIGIFLTAPLSRIPRVPTMATNSQRPKGQAGLLSALNVAIEALNLAKEISSVTPAKAVFGSVSVLLTMISVRFPPVVRRRASR